MRERNRTLDVIKAFACFGVVFIHREFPGVAGDIIASLSRSGVALFFMISGFYSYENDVEKSYLKVIRTLKLLGWALLYYLIWETFIRWYGSGWASASSWITGHVLSLKTWFNAIVFDYDPVAGHLWFLFALVKCYLVLLILVKNRIQCYSKVIMSVSLSLVYVLEIIYPEKLMYYRNGLCYGLGFFIMGYVLSEYKEKLKQSKSVVIVFAGILGLIAVTVEHVFSWKKQMFIGTIIMAVAIFVWAVKHPTLCNADVSIFEAIGFKYSVTVYVLHWSINEVFIKIDKMQIFNSVPMYDWFVPIFVLVISIFSAVAFERLKKSVLRFKGGNAA